MNVHPGIFKGDTTRESERRKSPSEVQGPSPGRSLGDLSYPEAEAKCEISVQFLTSYSTKFKIEHCIGAELGHYFCANN